MTHADIIISGNDLCDAFGSYDSQDVADLLGFDSYEAIDWGGFWLVSWPEHVVTPRYNADANFAFVGKTFAEATADFPEAQAFSFRY